MLDVFRGLKSLIKVNHIKTDSPVFRLHYSITVMFLLSFSLIVTTRQYVGNPIDCIHTKDIPEDVLVILYVPLKIERKTTTKMQENLKTNNFDKITILLYFNHFRFRRIHTVGFIQHTR